ncbi:golvesin C-terminal-like domain-containing protein [Flavobacterium sp. W21_SRS_FM6]|uniref:golvesin C-terminal-like domain-containing protein n=1 Tax=Flavobacterium sp. W21_SRS_FM6 TaxID=3240268 RepID=UPI003F922559
MKLKGFFARISLCVLLSAPFVANATVITIDNSDAGFISSGFTNSSFVKTFIGSNYMVDRVNKSGDFAIWDPTSSSDWLAGIWQVEMFWAAGSNRAESSAVSIDSGSAISKLFVDQTINGGAWFELGSYNFAAAGATVKIDDTNSTVGRYVMADAVRFTLVSATQAAVVSAPSSLLLLLLGAGSLVALRRKSF